MSERKRYTKREIAPEKIRRWQKSFFDKAGPSLRLFCDLAETFPSIAVTIKDAAGRIMYTNPYNARLSGWSSPADLIGYTSWELYAPDLAAVYGGRDKEVFETGVPIVERIYGFVADRSPALNRVTVRPITGTDGTRIGTATTYYRAAETMLASNWYKPISGSIAYLNKHIAENIPISTLAKISHYSENQYRRLFCKLTKMSPSEYIAKTRINLAKTLLRTTDASITEIATRTGFYDHSHFIRTFKSVTGVTPSTFRKA